MNLNAAEAAPDADLEVGHQSPVLVDGGGGDDLLTASAGGPETSTPRPGSLLDGGQGDDTLIGGDGSDGLIDGPGDDRIKAGPGSDGVISVGHGRDHVDCGPGFDLVLVDLARRRAPLREGASRSTRCAASTSPRSSRASCRLTARRPPRD